MVHQEGRSERKRGRHTSRREAPLHDVVEEWPIVLHDIQWLDGGGRGHHGRLPARSTFTFRVAACKTLIDSRALEKPHSTRLPAWRRGKRSCPWYLSSQLSCPSTISSSSFPLRLYPQHQFCDNDNTTMDLHTMQDLYGGSSVLSLLPTRKSEQPSHAKHSWERLSHITGTTSEQQ